MYTRTIELEYNDPKIFGALLAAGGAIGAGVSKIIDRYLPTKMDKAGIADLITKASKTSIENALSIMDKMQAREEENLQRIKTLEIELNETKLKLKEALKQISELTSKLNSIKAFGEK